MSTQICIVCPFSHPICGNPVMVLFWRPYAYGSLTEHLIHRPLFTMKTSLDQLSLVRFTIRGTLPFSCSYCPLERETPVDAPALAINKSPILILSQKNRTMVLTQNWTRTSLKFLVFPTVEAVPRDSSAMYVIRCSFNLF